MKYTIGLRCEACERSEVFDPRPGDRCAACAGPLVEKADVPPHWITERERYSLRRNGFGHYWPTLEVRGTYAGNWYPVIIRDSNPFKTERGAVKFVEAIIARRKARSA